jgi:hypothetical protein
MARKHLARPAIPFRLKEAGYSSLAAVAANASVRLIVRLTAGDEVDFLLIEFNERHFVNHRRLLLYVGFWADIKSIAHG